jgi:type IX secretion system PorP/SprF family membrane protein
MKLTLLIAFFIAFTLPLRAQQEPMYTQYMFNKTLFNPACVGSNGHLAANIIHRQQWIGFDGAPVTQAFNIHSPLRSEKIGVGLSLVRDKIGPTETYDLFAAYAYQFQLGYDLKLALGVQGGFTNWHTDFLNVNVENGTDQVFQQNFTIWKPNFGAGAYIYSKKFYAGIGCPRLLEHNLGVRSNDQNPIFASNYRHFYGTLGAVFPIGNSNMVFRPSAMVKTTGLGSSFYRNDVKQNIGAPTTVDLDASVFMQETLWLGLAFRSAYSKKYKSAESLDLRVAWYFRNGLRMGASYDILLSKIRTASAGSIEVMLGYEFDIKISKVASPRYF